MVFLVFAGIFNYAVAYSVIVVRVTERSKKMFVDEKHTEVKK